MGILSGCGAILTQIRTWSKNSQIEEVCLGHKAMSLKAHLQPEWDLASELDGRCTYLWFPRAWTWTRHCVTGHCKDSWLFLLQKRRCRSYLYSALSTCKGIKAEIMWIALRPASCRAPLTPRSPNPSHEWLQTSEFTSSALYPNSGALNHPL